MIVVDVGCANYENWRSVGRLARRFKPRVIYGFDPNPDEVQPTVSSLVRSSMAAWTRDGTLTFHNAGGASRPGRYGREVSCFDLAAFIEQLPDEEIVLKLDCEGSEYELLRHLRERDIDKRLKLCLVEWHADERVELRCPVEEWDF